MQSRLDTLRQTLRTLQKSYDDALNQSQAAELLLTVQLDTSESSIRNQLENNMKQRFVHTCSRSSSVQFACHRRLASLELRRQKLVEQSTYLVSQIGQIRVAAIEWQSNLTNLSTGESDLTVESSNELRERVTRISQEAKQLDEKMNLFANQINRLQEMSRDFDRQMKRLRISVYDASRVGRKAKAPSALACVSFSLCAVRRAGNTNAVQ